MASIFESDYIDISIPVLARISGESPFDIYIRRSEASFTRLFPKGEGIDQKRLKSYFEKKGIESLWVKKEDYRQYLLYAEKVANHCISNPDQVGAEEMVDLVKELANLTMLEIFVQTHLDPQSITHATETVKGCVEALAKDPKAFINLLKLMHRHPYLMKHAIQTSVLSLLLAKKEGLESSKTLMTIGMGALLHDVGVSQLSYNPEDREQLSAAEWKEMKEHPQIGKRLLDAVPHVSSEVRQIVLQHHEQPNGMGYPNGLHDQDIYYPAKIVSIADSFSALINLRPYRQAVPPLKALEIMVEDRGKFNPKILANFTEIFVVVKKE